MLKKTLRFTDYSRMIFINLMLLIVLSCFFFYSCATGPTSGKASNNQVSGKNSTPFGSTGGNELSGTTNDPSLGGKSSSGKSIDFLSFKLPFDLSTLKIENLSPKEKDLFAGFFGLTFAGAYAGVVVTKLFFKKK